MKSMLEAMLGAELGDDIDMNSPEDLLQRAHAKMEEQQAREAAENQAREERRAKRKKSAKQLAAQARQEAEQAQLSQSIREVYRKVASALHPDREPDPQERQRKTALMQRANQAYGNNNLLQLLELQLELEHIDQSAINNIGEERLKHYNVILKEQLGELDQEILHVEARFRHAYRIPPFIDISPDTAVRNLTGDIAGIQQSVRDLKQDLQVFEEIRTLKSWLKSVKRQHATLRFDEKMPF
jgi:curved DNA-binding protein CbpA